MFSDDFKIFKSFETVLNLKKKHHVWNILRLTWNHQKYMKKTSLPQEQWLLTLWLCGGRKLRPFWACREKPLRALHAESFCEWKVASRKVFGFCTSASYISFAHPLVIVSALGSFIFVLGRIRSSFWVAQRRWRWGWSGDRGEQRPGCNPCRTPSVPLSMSSWTRLLSWRTLLRNREIEI